MCNNITQFLNSPSLTLFVQFTDISAVSRREIRLDFDVLIHPPQQDSCKPPAPLSLPASDKPYDGPIYLYMAVSSVPMLTIYCIHMPWLGSGFGTWTQVREVACSRWPTNSYFRNRPADLALLFQRFAQGSVSLDISLFLVEYSHTLLIQNSHEGKLCECTMGM